MKKSFLPLFFFIFFTNSLVAKADSALTFVDEPAQCFSQESYPCAVRALEPLRLQRGEDVYQFSAQTSVVWITAEELRVLEGRVWIEKSNKISLHLLGTETISLSGEFFLTHEKNQNLFVMNLNGNVQFPQKGFLKSEALPVGFQNWYGRRSTNGNVERGILSPIDGAVFMSAWAKTGVMKFASRSEKVKQYRELWKDNVEQSALFYKQVAERRIANQEDAITAEQRRQQQFDAERARLRQMFHDKNGM